MPKSAHTTEEPQAVLAESLHKLEPTGELSFEVLLADALTEFTNRPFYVVKSGHQEGSDVRSEPHNLFRIGLEAKRYGSSSTLSLDALRQKITDAAAARRPVDLWILAATRSISASDREQLQSHGEQCGISVLVLDWPNEPTRLCDLAVICGAAARTCEKILKPTARLSAALKKIRMDIEFEQIRSRLFQRLTQADVGYTNARNAGAQWMDEAQSSLANAKSRLGGHHNLRQSEFGVVSRTTVNLQLDEWHSSGHGFAAVLGDEGTGKSWAVLDWHHRLRSSADGAPLTVFLRASSIDTSNDVRSAIAGALRAQTGIGSSSFWKRRLELWETCQGDGVRILVLIDGLNENFHFSYWAEWLQPLFEDRLIGMYRIIVSCWPEWWRTSLAKMINLVPQPMEIIVERFSDSELDLLLNAMKVTRSDFAHAVLELMRVPRLSSLVMTHRDKLRDSGDVTAERVVYEDWKDRLSRRGPKVGLTDEQMKAFVAELGKKLQLDLTQALTRGEVVRSLSEESGKAEMSLQIVVAELASGRWLQPGTKPNTLRVMKDRIPYVLAVALISNFGEELDVEILEAKIAEFLDPLKAHSLGASILRAATTIALIETEVSAACRKVLMSKWLEEQNFRAGDFDAFWRVIGIQPDLIFDLAEEWWLARRGRSFIDEAFIKAIANAASFPGFRTALQVRLATWLGTAWPDPKVGEFLGKVDTTSSEAKRRVKITRARYRQWTGSQSAGAFVNVQLDNSNRDWSWLSARELAILSYLDRAPFATAFEAWALSRSIMDRPRHESEMAWVVRLNLKDDREATNTLRDLIRRLERHDHPICTQAIKYLEAAMSHVQRAVEPPALKDSRRDDPVSAFQVPEMSYSDLVDATREYLRPYTWKKHEPETSAELINAFVTRGLDEDEAGIELILDHLRDLLTILTTDSRRRLRETICNKLSECSIDSTPEKQPNFGIQSSLLTLQLYDADPEEQSTLILNGQIGSEIDTWLPVLRPLTISDVGEPNFDDIADTDITGWLDYVDERLCRDDVNGLEFLPMFTAHNDAAVRKAALRLAIHGRHLGALEAFAQSPYSPPIPGDEKVDREHEYLRNCALLELHHFRPPQIVSDGLSSEAVALIAKHKPDNADALNNFHNYLRQQFAAIKYEKSWSAPRYWCSYGTTVEAVVESDLNAVLQWLRPWLEEPGNHLERALMDHFPVIDAMQALGNLAPKESIDLYKLLIERTRGGMFSSEGLKSFPFSVPASKEVDELCSQQLLEAINDKSLLEIVYFAHKHSRLDWLFEAIIELETSERPVDVAKAYTLLGFCDKGTRADTLWKCYLERPPTDAWLKCVLSCSVVNYRGNEDARQAFIEYWNSKSSAVSRHALKQVLDTSDLRILLWIGSIQPDWSDCPYDRRLLWSWVTAQLNDAIKKNRDARKKEFVHTRLAYSMMCPWKLTNVA